MTRSGIQDIRKGMLASFAGTIVLSIIMVMKQMAGLLPQMNPIADLAGIAHRLIGLPAAALIGWVLHFGVGIVVWGTLFAALHQRISGSNLITCRNADRFRPLQRAKRRKPGRRADGPSTLHVKRVINQHSTETVSA